MRRLLPIALATTLALGCLPSRAQQATPAPVPSTTADLPRRTPSLPEIERRMRELQASPPTAPSPAAAAAMSAAEEARVKALANARTAPITMPDGVVLPQRQGPTPTASEIRDTGSNPEDLAKLYAQLERGETHDDAWPVMIFASLSMPEANLLALARASSRSGVPLVFRGLRFGMKAEGLQRGLLALKPYIVAGANVQLHPELFEYYDIAAVPTIVVTGRPKVGCSDDRCDADFVRLVGDVSLDYALDQVASRRDDIGSEARKILARLRR